MIVRIQKVQAMPDYQLRVVFDDGKEVIYDVKEDIKAIRAFQPLRTEQGLFKNFRLDDSRTCISWSDEIDLPSDTLYEYGQPIEKKESAV